MKIAILSMQKVYNYGSVLQAYSLKKIIEDIVGEEVEFLNPQYDKKIPVNMEVKDNNDYEGEIFIDNKVTFYVKKAINKLKNKQFKNKVKEFQEEILKLDENNIYKQYDIVVQGSDEVFKCKRGIFYNLYGDVPNTKKLITYAASCGSANVNGISNENIENVREIMKNFNAMSVRDKNTESYIKHLYDGKIEMHLDPVLVGDLNKREHKTVKHKNYMIVYAYGDRIHKKEEINAIKQYAKKNKLKTLAIGAPQYWCDEFIAVSPFEALDYFFHADCVVTDTFHGTIFSIINKCKFATIVRKTNKNKLEDLLRKLNLSGQEVKEIDKIGEILEKNINYDDVENIIEKERLRTKEYLTNNLKL